MLNNSIPGETVYEPFLGSGTTLIAAESTGRVCLGVEIDPLYVDVAIRRWQAFAGQTAKLLGSGQSFDQVALERGSTKATSGLVSDESVRSPAAKHTSAGSP